MSLDQVTVMDCGTWYSFFLKENHDPESFFFFLLAEVPVVKDSHPNAQHAVVATKTKSIRF
jgi:hypothetical protein